MVLVESESSPSMQVNRALSVCSASSLLPLTPESLRFLPRASISSINIIHGPPIFLALANNCRTRAAPVPAYFSTKSLPEHEIRGTSADAAVARAASSCRCLEVPPTEVPLELGLLRGNTSRDCARCRPIPLHRSWHYRSPRYHRKT